VPDENFLKNVTLFMELDPQELDDLRKCFQTTRFAAGDLILEEGKANRALHVVRSGRIRVKRQVESGEVALTDLIAGQTFGELSIIEDGVASATLQAVSDTEVSSVSMNDLAAFLRDKPGVAAKFWRQIAVDLRRRLIQTNDLVRSHFEVNRALAENPTFRQVYAMCNR
jgi:CRP/FNR family transcriptional regulator, cyclic AMP receptor protein